MVNRAKIPATRAATVIPKNPPRTTSFLFRLFMVKSAPAAPAVAKKPAADCKAAKAPRAMIGMTAAAAALIVTEELKLESPSMLANPAMTMITNGKTGIQLESQASHLIPTAPTRASRNPQTIQTNQKRGVFGPASERMADMKNEAAEKVNTACQPICKKPMRSPGISIPPLVPNVEAPTTYNGIPVCMPNSPGT